MSDTSERGHLLTNVFSKTRREKRDKGNSEGGSVRSSITDSSSQRRGSVGSIAGKSLNQGREGGEGAGTSSVLKKLVPSGLAAKRRQKREEEEQAQRQTEEEFERGKRILSRGVLRNPTSSSFPPFDAGDGDNDGSSQITYDSDEETPGLETQPQRDPLLSHPSHAGYLTTSSPLIHSTTLSAVPSSIDDQLDGAPVSQASSINEQSDNLADSKNEPDPTKNLLRTPSEEAQRRSPSPGRRLKEALRPGRRGPSPNSSPERQAAGGGGLEQLQKQKSDKISVDNSRRGSVASRLGSIFPDNNKAQSNSATSSPERPRTGKIQPINTTAPPSTPPPPPGEPAPIIVNTPPTPTDPGSPRFTSNHNRVSSDPSTFSSSSSNPNVITSQSGNMISHRRIRSGSTTLVPSKLSNITSAPLTPTPENGSTTPNPQSGFFSSVFSAAQNAANTLTNSIQNTSVAPGAKHKINGSIQELKEPDSPEVELLADKHELGFPTEEKELAVKTLGMGDLSLSHLGISETNSAMNTPVSSKFPEETRGRSEYKHDDSSARASSPVRLDGADFEAPPTPEVEDAQTILRPRSFYGDSTAGEHTPPNGSVFEGKGGLQRSGSIRSALGNRRKRGSSAATGTTSTIGAMISAAHSSVAHPTASPPGASRITGFAVASTKRSRDFHQLFRSVPEDDYLIEDYSCALQREILAHGRLYVSEGHLCFSSNIFGWVTTLVMSFDEIVSVEKRNTALLFKNGLEISTLHAKNIFASFTNRDATYDLIVGIWKLGHPSLRSSLNGVRIDDAGGGDKTEKLDGDELHGSHSGSESESGEDDSDGDVDDDDGTDAMSNTHGDGSVAGSDLADRTVVRKPSAVVVPNGTVVEVVPPATGDDFPGPATHPPTNCTDGDTHYPKVLANEVVQAPLGKIFSLMFGPASTTWMANWLTLEQKCLELTMDGENSKKPLSLDNKVRHYSYIKPLSGSIGPKQTKCICTETLDSLDLERAVSVTISTQTPDVPSGNVFSVKTKYCLSWAEGNATRIQINCAIEWTGKSWLKGPIEKGANDGQVKYAKDILASLEAAVSSKRSVVAAPGKKGKKGKKSKTSTSLSRQTDGASDSKSEAVDWGLLEPIRPILGPVFSIFSPLITPNMLYGLFVGLLVASWFSFGMKSDKVDVGGWSIHTPARIAAYEEIWRREESDLWEWLDDRVGMERLHNIGASEMRVVEDRLKGENMKEREVDHAIKVTEERLRVLKQVVEKDKLRKEGGKSKLPVESTSAEL